MKHSNYKYLIIGGGINGLCTAFELIQRGISNIALFESKQIGHDLGSSHGKSRITRSAYADATYVKMMQMNHQFFWPKLESILNTQLRYPCKGLFYGPMDGEFQKYYQAFEECDVKMRLLSPQDASSIFPVFNFTSNDGILYDETAAVIAAEESISQLKNYCLQHIDIYENCPIEHIESSNLHIVLHSQNQQWCGEKCIVTIGAWTSQLLPFLQTRLQVVHQNVYYLKLQQPEHGRLPQFPVWVELSMIPNDMYYGLPEFQRPGIKTAKHQFKDPGEESDNPNIKIQPTREEIEQFVTRFQKRLNIPILSVENWERCQYTNTINEDFILDTHPKDKRIIIGAGFSGHGFKFGPMTGAILADLAMFGNVTIADFAKERFAISTGQEN